MRIILASVLVLGLASSALPCEQFRNGPEIIDFVDDMNFVLANRDTGQMEIYSITGAGTGVMALVASDDAGTAMRVESISDSVVVLDGREFKCDD